MVALALHNSPPQAGIVKANSMMNLMRPMTRPTIRPQKAPCGTPDFPLECNGVSTFSFLNHTTCSKEYMSPAKKGQNLTLKMAATINFIKCHRDLSERGRITMLILTTYVNFIARETLLVALNRHLVTLYQTLMQCSTAL